MSGYETDPIDTGSDSEPAQAPTRSQEKRLGFAALSALIPGAGQIAAGFRWRGAIMVLVSLVLVGIAFYYYQQGLSTVLSYLVQPRILIAVFVVNLLFLLFRLASVIDAYWSTRTANTPKSTGWRQGVVGLVLAALLAFTAVPHAVVGYYVYLSHELITDVFSTEELVTELEESIPTPTPEPTQVPDPEPTPVESSNAGNSRSPTPSSQTTKGQEPGPKPTSTPGPDFAEWDWHERSQMTVLHAGSASAKDRPGARTDGILLVSLDVNSGQPALFSIPRNFGDFPLSKPIDHEMGMIEFPEMISHLYGHAQAYSQIASIGFVPPDFVTGEASEGHKRSAYDLIRETVQTALGNPEHYL